LTIDLETLADDQDASDCNKCGVEYVFTIKSDPGICAECGGSQDPEQPTEWQRHMAKRAEARKNGARRLVRSGPGRRMT
jgi:hypothetical protein